MKSILLVLLLALPASAQWFHNDSVLIQPIGASSPQVGDISITGTVYAGAISGQVINGVRSGTFTLLPTCNVANTGILYIVTDGPMAQFCNGTAWGPAMKTQHATLNTSPVPGTWVQQGTCTMAASGSGITSTCPSDAAGSVTFRGKCGATPATPYTRKYAYPRVSMASSTTNVDGAVGWRNVANGKYLLIEKQGTALQVRRWSANPAGTITTVLNAATAGSITYSYGGIGGGGWGLAVQPDCLQIGDNGTNLTVGLSWDGCTTFVSYYSEARTAHVNVPDQICVGMVPYDSDTTVDWDWTE